MFRLPRFLVSLAMSLGVSADMLRLSDIPPSMRSFSRNKRRRTTRFTQHCGARQSARYGRQLALGQIHDHLENAPLGNEFAAFMRDMLPDEPVELRIGWQPHPAHDGATVRTEANPSRQVQRRQALDGFRPKRAKRPVRVGSGLAIQQARHAQPRLKRASR